MIDFSLPRDGLKRRWREINQTCFHAGIMDRARARQNLFYPRSRAAQLFVAPSSIPRDVVAIGRSECFFFFRVWWTEHFSFLFSSARGISSINNNSVFKVIEIRSRKYKRNRKSMKRRRNSSHICIYYLYHQENYFYKNLFLRIHILK